MNKIGLKYLFAIITFIIYIYSVNINLLPLSLKQLLAVIGLFVFLFNLRHIRKTKMFLSLLMICLSIQFWGLITCLLNNSNEYYYLNKYLISTCSSFFASFLICKLFSSCINSVDDFFKFTLYAVLVESLLTVLIFAIPSLYDFADSIGLIIIDERVKENIFAQYRRFNGIGEAIYFGVIPSCSFGVMSGLYLQMKNRNTYKYIFIVIIISVISFFVARYSGIVVGVCFLIYFRHLLRGSKIKFLKFSIVAMVILALIIKTAVSLLPEQILNWAMAVFDSDSSRGGSKYTVINWLLSTSFENKTFIIGDAQYTNADGSYYGHVDIGLFRQIFYGGIIGFLLVFFLHKRIIKCINNLLPNDPNVIFFTFGMLLSYLVSLLKGDLSMVDLLLFVLVNITFIVTKNEELNRLQKNNI